MTLPQNFSPNADLTGISLAYKNESYIADIVLPRIAVNHKSFEYKEYPVDAFLGVHNTLVGDKGEPKSIDIKSTPKYAGVQGHSLKAEVPVSDIEDAQGTGDDPEGDNTVLLTEGLAVAREKRVAEIFADTSNFGGSVTLSGTDKLTDKENSNAVTLFLDCIASMPIDATHAVINNAVATALQTHPDFLASYNSTGATRGIVPLEYIAQVLKLKGFIVGKARINSAKAGQNPQILNAWGNNIALVHINPLAKPKYGLTFGFTAEKGSREITEFLNPSPGTKGVKIIKASEELIELITAKSAGYLIKNAV